MSQNCSGSAEKWKSVRPCHAPYGVGGVGAGVPAAGGASTAARGEGTPPLPALLLKGCDATWPIVRGVLQIFSNLPRPGPAPREPPLTRAAMGGGRAAPIVAMAGL